MGNFMTAKIAFEDMSFYSKVSKTSYKSYVSPRNTMIILDWDDTLMCTTFITSKKNPLSPQEMAYIERLGNSVSEFLLECKKFGKVIILTNSTEVWVNSCSEKLLKLPKEVMDNVKIISARDKFLKEKKHKIDWKKMAFEELIQNYFSSNKSNGNSSILNGSDSNINYLNFWNFLCVSDSSDDINLFKLFKEKFSEWMNLSTVKLKRKPSPLEMINQLKFMTQNLKRVVGKNGNYFLDNGNNEKKRENNDESSGFNKTTENFRKYLNLSLFGI